jgi:WD40 repeat protein
LLAYPAQQWVGSIVVRDAHTLALIKKLTFDPLQTAQHVPDNAHATILIAPDGHTVYCAYRAFTVAHGFGATYLARWSLPDGSRLSTRRLDDGAVLAVGLIGGGSRIVVIDRRNVTIFHARSLRRLSSVAIRPALAAPSTAAVSPDGHTIAIGSRTGAISFVDTATGYARRALGPTTGSVARVAYAPDGSAVATAVNNTLIVWNPRSARARQTLTVPGGQVQGIAFSPDARSLYTSSVGGLALEWDLAGDRSFGRRVVLGEPSRCCDPVAPLAPALAVSPDGTTFAIRIAKSSVGLFATGSLQPRGSFTVTPKRAVTALAWAPTSRELAVGGSFGLVQQWRTDGTPRLLRSLSGLEPILGKPEAIHGLAYSPDGRLIAASNNSETIPHVDSGSRSPEHPNDRLASMAIWHSSSGKLSAMVDLGTGTARFDPLAFSPDRGLVAVTAPDGRNLVVDATTGHVRRTIRPAGSEHTGSLAFAHDGTLATGSLSGKIELWNPLSGGSVAGPLPVNAGPVPSIAFQASDRRFATTASQDGTVRLFATSTLQQQGTTFNTDQSAASSARFEPKSNTLIVVNDRGNVFKWPASVADWERRACAVAGRNLTRQEWSQYLPGQPYTRVCP